MKILDKESLKCDLQLNFCSKWPKSMPHAAWQDQLITPEGSSQYAIDYSMVPNMTLQGLIKEIYPQLSLVELSYLYTKWSETKVLNSIGLFSWEQLFQSYNLRWCENLKNTLISIQELSSSFQEWALQKKCMQNDLAPIRRMNNFSILNKYITQAIKLSPTKTQGVQLLEMLCDLIELEEIQALEQAFMATNIKDLERQLKKGRYPKSQKDMENKSLMVKNWPWPLYTEAKWSRRGDKAGIEIKIFVSSQEEFAKKVKGLQNVVAYSENQENKIW